MSDTAEITPATKLAPIRRRKRAAAKPVPVPPPPALQQQVTRAAKIIQRHQRVLGEVGINALRVATLQVVAQKLAELQALLQANGFSGALTQVAAQPVQQRPPERSCAMCGRPGVYQSKTARVEKGTQRPWYCEGEHANWARMEDGGALAAQRIMPSGNSAPGQPNLSAAMAALSGE